MIFRDGICVCVLILAIAHGSYAETAYKSVEPGRTNRTEAEEVLGNPLKEISDTLVEYGSKSGGPKVYVQYHKGTSIVDRLELLLSDTVTRSDMIASMKLPEKASASGSTKTMRIEYFGNPYFIALIYSASDSSKIRSVGYYSRESFDRAVEIFAKNPETDSATAEVRNDGPQNEYLGAADIPGDQAAQQPECCSLAPSSVTSAPPSGPRSSLTLKISNLHVPATVSGTAPQEFTFQAQDSKGNLKEDVLIQMDVDCGGQGISSRRKASSIERKDDAGSIVVHGIFNPALMPKGNCTLSIQLQDSAGNLSNPLQSQVQFN